MQKMQHFKKYCNLQHVFPKTICSFNLKQPFWKGLRFLKWMLQYFKEYHNFWWKMFVKRNAATVQGVLCVVMNIFSKKCFRKECNFQLNPPSWKGHTFFKWNSMNMRRNFHKKNRFSEICLPEYVMYASGIFYIRRLFFFSNLDNVLFLSMFYVVMHRCVEMHVDVYDIDAFRCTTIYIYIYICIQMIVDVYRSQI